MLLDRRRARRHWDWWPDEDQGISGSFSFANVTGFVSEWKASGTLWQDSARTTPAAADADPVGAWDDTAGLHNLTQATGTKRGTLKLAQQNGLPAVRFDGVDDFLAAGAFAQNQPFTVYLVLKCVAGAVHRYIHSANTDIAGAYQSVAGSYTLYAPSNGPSVALGTTQFNIVCGIMNGASSQARLNGGSAVTGNPGTNNLDGFSLPTKTGGPGQFDYCHVLLYSGAHGASDETTVRNGLNAIYLIF